MRYINLRFTYLLTAVSIQGLPLLGLIVQGRPYIDTAVVMVYCCRT